MIAVDDDFGRLLATLRLFGKTANPLLPFRGRALAIAKMLTALRTDSSDAYAKSVPVGKHHASLEQVGSRTIVWNQLNWDNNTFTKWISNAQCSIVKTNDTLSITALNNVTNNAYTYLPSSLNPTPLVAGHKYFVSADISTDNSGLRIQFGFGGTGTNVMTASVTPETRSVVFGIVEAIAAGNNAVGIYPFYTDTPSEGDTATLFSLEYFDLTRMFGTGNEPATPEQFKSMFPAEYYAYDTGTLKSAGVTSVVSKDADAVTLGTYTIPAEIQALTGYGWSAGDAYNYIDFERKVYVQHVASVDLGTLSWRYSATPGHEVFYASLADIKPVPTENDNGNLICSNYTTTSQRNVYLQSADTIISTSPENNNPHRLWIYDIAKMSMSGADFSVALSGMTLYYELDTPIETDISAYLTDDATLDVESGGTLTFENQNGDDYRIPVPSTVAFAV